jgi:hypothetical protein
MRKSRADAIATATTTTIGIDTRRPHPEDCDERPACSWRDPDRDSSTARNINKTLRSFAPEVCLIMMFLLPGEESN